MEGVPLPGILAEEPDVLEGGEVGDGVGMGEGFEGRVVTEVLEGDGPPVDVGDVARHFMFEVSSWFGFGGFLFAIGRICRRRRRRIVNTFDVLFFGIVA